MAPSVEHQCPLLRMHYIVCGEAETEEGVRRRVQQCMGICHVHGPCKVLKLES